MKTLSASVILIFLGMKAWSGQIDSPTRFFDSNCQTVEAKRKELIEWNLRISKAGVETFKRFSSVIKSSRGCEIDLNQFIPKTISERNYPGFNSRSETNCHGTTQFLSGLSTRLQRALSVSPATNFQSLCQEIRSYNDLKAGDIGLIQNRNTDWRGQVETDHDVHSFTYLSGGSVLQSPNMEVGKYPEIASFQSPIEQYVTGVRDPENNPNCQDPAANKDKCKIWIKYYRCDFSPPKCFDSVPKNLQQFSVDLDRLRNIGKPRCAACEAENQQNRCSPATKDLQIQIQKIRNLADRVHEFSSWEQLAEVALKPLDPDLMAIVKRLKDIDQIENREEKKALSLTILELDGLRKAITSKVGDLETKHLPRPTGYGIDIERLSPGFRFSIDQPKDSKFSADLLICLQVKLSKSDSKFVLDNCKQVFDSVGL